MNADRSIARVVGVLFILATVFSLASTSVVGPVLGASDYLSSASMGANRIILGVLLLLAAAGAIVLIPAMIFPVLKRINEGMALGYLGLRIIEAVTLVVDAISLLSLVSSGQQYVKAGAATAFSFQVAGALSVAVHTWIFSLNPVVFGSGALIFYYLLYCSRLVPRWLSAWGLVGALAILAFGLLGMYGDSLLYLAAPIGVQEMALAVWLIAKGFHQPAVVLESHRFQSHELP
jgi:hypothetical protein